VTIAKLFRSVQSEENHIGAAEQKKVTRVAAQLERGLRKRERKRKMSYSLKKKKKKERGKKKRKKKKKKKRKKTKQKKKKKKKIGAQDTTIWSDEEKTREQSSLLLWSGGGEGDPSDERRAPLGRYSCGSGGAIA